MAITAKDLAYTESSPHQLKVTQEIAASKEVVFDALMDAPGWRRWFRDCLSCEWTTPAPYGVGSEREIQLKLVTATERILAADPGERFAFTLIAVSKPLAKAMLEDFRLSDAGNGKTRIDWTMHYEPSALARAIHPILRAVFKSMLTKSLRTLETRIERKRTGR